MVPFLSAYSSVARMSSSCSEQNFPKVILRVLTPIRTSGYTPCVDAHKLNRHKAAHIEVGLRFQASSPTSCISATNLVAASLNSSWAETEGQILECP
jgi:hypothetical protein